MNSIHIPKFYKCNQCESYVQLEPEIINFNNDTFQCNICTNVIPVENNDKLLMILKNHFSDNDIKKFIIFPERIVT